MQFAKPWKANPPAVAYAKNLETAYRLAGRIHRRREQGKIFRALLDYGRLVKLQQPVEYWAIKPSSIGLVRVPGIKMHGEWISKLLDGKRLEGLKEDAAFDLNDCGVQDAVERVRKAQAFAIKARMGFAAKWLQPLVDAYSDVRKTDLARRENEGQLEKSKQAHA